MPALDDDRLDLVLDDASCRRLLATTTTGRLGFSDCALPAIVPVAFLVHDGQVLIPARRGSPVVHAVRGSVVVVQADAYDSWARTGWSVTVVGTSRIISDPQQVALLNGLVLPAGPDRCFIAVQMGLVRGWRSAELSVP